MNVLLTGGSGFIGSNLVRLLLPERPDWRSRQPRQAHLRGERREPRRPGGQPALPLRARRHLQRRARRGHLPDREDRRGHAPRGREPRGPLDPGAVRLHRDERARHAGAARGGARARREAVPPRLDRRGLRLARPDRPLHRDDAARSVVPVLGVQGLERPARARLRAAPSSCRWWSRAARTTTARTSSRRSSSRS